MLVYRANRALLPAGWRMRGDGGTCKSGGGENAGITAVNQPVSIFQPKLVTNENGIILNNP